MRVVSLTNDLRWHPCYRDAIRHWLENDRACCHSCVAPDLNAAQDCGAGAYQGATADFWVSVASLFASAAKRYTVKNGYVIFDDGCFADDESGGMIEKNATPYTGRRMDVALKHRGRAALQI